MGDKELLELAGKAAGYKLIPYTWNMGAPFAHHGFTIKDEGDDEWNPLEDDGQALRLAVACKMQISLFAAYALQAVVFLPLTAKLPTVMEFGKNDNEAATRRAIVRAAAEIGKAMP